MATNLPAITPKKAIENITKQFPAEAAALEAVVNSNVVALGENEVFTLRDKEGEIKAFKTTCRLTVQNGGLVSLPIGGGINIISAQGYEIWAEKAAASVIFPTEVMVYGQPMPNPAPLKDAEGNWIGWAVRAAAFRFSSMGLPQVSDRTVIFDIETWKNIDFLAKAKKYKQAFRIMPKGQKSPDETGSWIEYPFDKSASLWVNASHEEALDWYSEISQRIKNSLQLAQTHAARNALKHLSGLQKAPDKTGTWDIPVITWRPVGNSIIKWDPTTYKTLQTKVSAIVSGNRSEFKEIEHNAGVDQLGEEDLRAVEAGEIDETSNISQEENQEVVIDVKPEPEKLKDETKKPKVETKAAKKETKLTAEEQKIMKNLKVMAGQFPDEFAQVCSNLGISLDDFGVSEAPKIVEGMNKILNG